MTLDTDISKIQYLGNGQAREFPLPFRVLEAEHLKLVLWQNGTESELTEGYSVYGLESGQSAGSGSASSGGLGDPGQAGQLEQAGGVRVLLDQAPPNGSKLTIMREVPLVQPTDLQNGGDFNAEVLEATFDYLEMQIQQNAEGIERAVKLAVSTGVSSDQYAEEIFQAHGETLEAAARAEAAASSAENSAAHSAAAAAQAKEDANRAAALLDPASLASSVFNVRKALLLENTVYAETPLSLPGFYFPGRDVLFLSFEGVVCTPRKGGVEPFGEYQYSEIGDDPNQPSNQVLLHFTAPAGAVFDMWVVSSAVGANIDAIAALAEDSAASAAAAAAQADRAEFQAERAEAAAGQGGGGGAAAVRADFVLAQALEAGSAFAVPRYMVGAGKLQIYYEGLLCQAGEKGSYVETGLAGAASESVVFNMALAAGTEITVIAAS